MMSFTLSLLEGTYAVCRLQRGSQIPEWALNGDLYSITRTEDELSVVCRQDAVPEHNQCNKGWNCFKVEGPLDFSMTGVISTLATALANEGVSVFVFSTYDTDYIMVRSIDLEKAANALIAAGHRVHS
jgi:hypothetical protein